eukprot:SAG31_NODE_32157_length_359_cov_0.830769_1_plen_44_part_01
MVFITKNYLHKVGGDNLGDNCKKEFEFADCHKIVALMMNLPLAR